VQAEAHRAASHQHGMLSASLSYGLQNNQVIAMGGEGRHIPGDKGIAICASSMFVQEGRDSFLMQRCPISSIIPEKNKLNPEYATFQAFASESDKHLIKHGLDKDKRMKVAQGDHFNFDEVLSLASVVVSLAGISSVHTGYPLWWPTGADGEKGRQQKNQFLMIRCLLKRMALLPDRFLQQYHRAFCDRKAAIKGAIDVLQRYNPCKYLTGKCVEDFDQKYCEPRTMIDMRPDQHYTALPGFPDNVKAVAEIAPAISIPESFDSYKGYTFSTHYRELDDQEEAKRARRLAKEIAQYQAVLRAEDEERAEKKRRKQEKEAAEARARAQPDRNAADRIEYLERENTRLRNLVDADVRVSGNGDSDSEDVQMGEFMDAGVDDGDDDSLPGMLVDAEHAPLPQQQELEHEPVAEQSQSPIAALQSSAVAVLDGFSAAMQGVRADTQNAGECCCSQFCCE